MKSVRLARLFKDAGKKPRLVCEECYFLTAVMVPFLFIHGEYHLLFEKRAAHIRQGGEVSFPGGVFDPNVDKNTRDTAFRETIEELKPLRRQVRLFPCIGTLIGGNGAAIDVYPGLLKIASLGELNPHKDEVEEVFTVPFSYFLQTTPEKYEARVELKSRYVDDNGREVIVLPAEELGLPAMYSGTWGRRNHAIFVYRYNGYIIWGITARIIQEIKKLWKENL